MVNALQLRALEDRHGLRSGLLSAVMHVESRGNQNAVGPRTRTGERALGAFQFMPNTAAAYGVDPFDPDQAAEGAARMFSDLSKQFGGDEARMLAAYNWGSGNVERYGMGRMPAETQNYVRHVMSELNSNGNSRVDDSEMPQEEKLTLGGILMGTGGWGTFLRGGLAGLLVKLIAGAVVGAAFNPLWAFIGGAIAFSTMRKVINRVNPRVSMIDAPETPKITEPRPPGCELDSTVSVPGVAEHVGEEELCTLSPGADGQGTSAQDRGSTPGLSPGQ